MQYYGESELSMKLARLCSMLLIPETQYVEVSEKTETKKRSKTTLFCARV